MNFFKKHNAIPNFKYTPRTPAPYQSHALVLYEVGFTVHTIPASFHVAARNPDEAKKKIKNLFFDAADIIILNVRINFIP